MGAVLEVVSKVAVILILILIGCFITKRSMLTERGVGGHNGADKACDPLRDNQLLHRH